MQQCADTEDGEVGLTLTGKEVTGFGAERVSVGIVAIFFGYSGERVELEPSGYGGWSSGADFLGIDLSV